MQLTTEFKFHHGDMLCLKSDAGQAAILIVHSLIADVCPAGVVQRKYGCRVTWRGAGSEWSRVEKTSNRLCKIDVQLANFDEMELVPYDASRDTEPEAVAK